MSTKDLWFKETLVPSTTYRPNDGTIVEQAVFDYEPQPPFLYQTRSAPPLAGSLYKLEAEHDTCVEWRVIQNNQVLEVSRLLLGHDRSAAELPSGGDTTQATAPIRFRFPSAILPSVSWFEDITTRRLHCLLLLVTGTVVRLSFHQPQLFQIQSLDAVDICIYRMQSLTGECAPVMMKSINANTIVVACTDGSLFSIELPKSLKPRSIDANGFTNQGVVETIFNPESLLAQMLVAPARMISHAFKRGTSGVSSSDNMDGMPVYEASSTPEQVVSMTTYTFDRDTFIFGICRDGYLRAWSLTRRKCIWSKPLLQHDPNQLENHRIAATATPSLLPDQPRRCIWLLDDVPFASAINSPTFHLLAYVPNDHEQVFTVLRGQLDQSGHLDQLCKVYTHPSPWTFSVANGGGDTFGLLDIACEYIMDSSSQTASHILRLWTLWQQQQQQVDIRFTFLALPTITSTTHEVEYEMTEKDDQQMTDSTTLITSVQTDTKISSIYRGLYGDRWFSVATELPDLFDLNQLNSMVEAQPEAVSQLYLQHIFFPNRFSYAIIEKALDRYESRSADRTSLDRKDNQPVNEALLVERVTNAVSRRLTLPVYEPTGALLLDEFSETVKKEWYRFLTICLQLREATRQPMGLFVDSSLGMVCTLRKRALSFIRRCSELELLWHHVDEQYDLAALSFLPADTFKEHFPSMIEQTGREDVTSLLEAIMSLQEDMGDEMLRYVEEELRVMLITATNEPLDMSGFDIYEMTRERLSSHCQYRLFGLIRGCHQLPKAIEQLLRVIQGPLPSGMDILPSQRASRLVESTVVAALVQRINTAHQLSIRLVILVLFCLLDPALKKVPRLESTLVARCVQTVRYCIMLKRLCDVSSASQVSSSFNRKTIGQGTKSTIGTTGNVFKEDDFIKYFTKLQVSDVTDASIQVADRYYYHSVIHSLIRSFYLVQIMSDSLSEVVVLGAEHIQSCLPGTIDSTQTTTMIEDENELEATKLAAHLLSLDQSHISYQSLQLLSSTPIVCHLRGTIHLRHNEYEKASDNFTKAGAQLETPALDTNASLALFNSVLVEPSSATALFGSSATATAYTAIDGYYAYVADLFEKKAHYEFAADFYRLALKFRLASSSNENQQLSAQLYSQLFKCHLALHQYDDAFMAMMENPDSTKQTTCLSQFIIKLCDHQQIGKLCGYAFGALQSEVETTLEFRARTCGVLSTPNYYRVLYAYHVHRGNFRHAARAMYNNAQGLGRVMPSTFHVDVIANQARSYLAAMNALHLVDGAHAWILVDDVDDDLHNNNNNNNNNNEKGNDSANMTRKRRRIRLQEGDIEAMNQASNRNDIGTTTSTLMIDIDDMKREYGLALARLQLIRSYPEIAKTMWAIKPADAVNLFNQRGQYGHAFALSKVFSLDLSPIFISMVRKCVRLAQEDLEGKPWAYNVQDRIFDISTDNDASCTETMEGPPSSRAWRLLEQLLERYDSSNTQYQYRALVLEETLKLNRHAKIPAWLVHFYTKHNPEDLIRIYLKHNLIEEAGKQALLQIEKEINASDNKPVTTSLHWLPYSLLDTLVKALEDSTGQSTSNLLGEDEELEIAMFGEDASSLAQLHRALSSKLNDYFNVVKTEDHQRLASAMI
ncbi:nucleoporin Nup120/160-domain-containing protein [Syncephalis fuscata]|nr:nucleoporin Nup120/160-domain-containing protein [Syncephalis fuscata]